MTLAKLTIDQVFVSSVAMNRNHEAIVPILNLDNDGLSVISPLGRGAKGVVFLVKQEACGEFWALKVILRDVVEKKKKEICSGDEYRRISFERQVLNHFNHPLLPKLRGVLATDRIIGYAIDFCPGRDLNHLRKQQTEGTFSLDNIRFYAAELVLALEYLHHQGIAYRDLKPENILIQENGHVMLVDFDLSTKISLKSSSNAPIANSISKTHIPRRRKRFSLFQRCCISGVSPYDSTELDPASIDTAVHPKPVLTEKSNSFVGTEEYVAPEVIQGNGHDFAVDWWSLGIVLYEMLYGTTPFKGTNRKETFYRILTKPPDLVGQTTPLRDLIRKLLIKDPKERIKIEEIKGHEFFKGIDWELILEMPRPPYIPPANQEKDGSKGNVKIDVESFVQGLFGGGEEQEKKVNETRRKSRSNDDDDDDDERGEEKENKGDGGMWVEGVHSQPHESDNFLVF